MGETYVFIGYPDLARDCFENAIKLYGLNFKYYQNLTQVYINLGITNSKIAEFSSSNDLYDKIKLGLLYINTGQTRRGVNVLDEICAQEPDLIITSAIKQYLKEVCKKL